MVTFSHRSFYGQTRVSSSIKGKMVKFKKESSLFIQKIRRWQKGNLKDKERRILKNGNDRRKNFDGVPLRAGG